MMARLVSRNKPIRNTIHPHSDMGGGAPYDLLDGGDIEKFNSDTGLMSSGDLLV
ncbi:hypothetical protein R50072_29110 [Simiduia litorea]